MTETSKAVKISSEVDHSQLSSSRGVQALSRLQPSLCTQDKGMVSRVHEDGVAYQLQNYRKVFRINKVAQTKRLRNQTGCLIARLRFGLPYAETGQAIRVSLNMRRTREIKAAYLNK
ncbi:hypothetical protein T02_12405 [Trichinella nativa]|uniref:Uncharacterized protein n=1 Tax=Trichinella nativa TaxID=6335 RepID=A0A0V1LPT9_9BILA|nr:hypothetical protein T02_12405 [Trichinella nativa]